MAARVGPLEVDAKASSSTGSPQEAQALPKAPVGQTLQHTLDGSGSKKAPGFFYTAYQHWAQGNSSL